MFAVDRANITRYAHIPAEGQKGRLKMGKNARKKDEGCKEGDGEWICGLYSREYYGFKVSRGLTE